MNTQLKWLVGIACVLVSVVCVGIIAFFALAIGGAVADEVAERAARARPAPTASAVQSARARCIQTGRTWRDGRCYSPPLKDWSCSVSLAGTGGSGLTRTYGYAPRARTQGEAQAAAREHVSNVYGSSWTRVQWVRCAEAGSPGADSPRAGGLRNWSCTVLLRRADTGEVVTHRVIAAAVDERSARGPAGDAALNRQGGEGWTMINWQCS